MPLALLALFSSHVYVSAYMPILTPLPSWRSKKAVVEPALRQQAQVRQAPLTVMKSASALPTEDPMSGGGEAPITILEELEDLEMQVKTKFDSAVKVGHMHAATPRDTRPLHGNALS